jgi:hypothetical protein
MTTFILQVPEHLEGDFMKIMDGFKEIKVSNGKSVTEGFKSILIDALNEVEQIEKGLIKKVTFDEFNKRL